MPSRFDPSTGGIIFIPQEKDNEVIIKSVEDFPSVIDSNKVYFLDKFIDVGDSEFIVPEAGMFLAGHGYGISGLWSSSANKKIFKTAVAGYSGDFIATGLTFYTTGAGSMIFDIDNDGNNSAFELNSVNLGVFGPSTTTNLGNVSGYRQFRTGDFAAINHNDGLTFGGDMQNFAINDSIILANIAATTFLKEGVALNIASGFSSNMNSLSMNATSTWCDFQASNFAMGAIMNLTGFRTGATNAIPNITGNSPKALFKNCVGVKNTFIGASWNLTTQAATIVSSTNTYYKVLGTTTGLAEAHFEVVGNNRLKYIGEKDISVSIICSIVMETSGTESLEVAIRHYDDSAAAFVSPNIDEKPMETALKLLGNRRDGTVLIGVANMSTDDYIELWSKTLGASTANPTLLLKSKLLISERV